jgi:hypothetical protein
MTSTRFTWTPNTQRSQFGSTSGIKKRLSDARPSQIKKRGTLEEINEMKRQNSQYMRQLKREEKEKEQIHHGVTLGDIYNNVISQSKLFTESLEKEKHKHITADKEESFLHVFATTVNEELDEGALGDMHGDYELDQDDINDTESIDRSIDQLDLNSI